MPTLRLTGILYACGNAIHGGNQRMEKFIFGAIGGTPSSKQIDLQQTDGVDIGISQTNTLGKALVILQQSFLILDRENGVLAADKFVVDYLEIIGMLIACQKRIAFKNRHIRFRQYHFNIVSARRNRIGRLLNLQREKLLH
jgi:hypothetical protein